MSKTIQESRDLLKQKAQAPAPKQDNSLRSYVNKMLPAIKRALPNEDEARRFSRAILTALTENPQLNECAPESFCGAMMMSAQLGLTPNTPLGHAYLLPYRNKGVMECQFQIGYKGMMELAWRSPRIKSIYAYTVYENDEFSYQLGLNPNIHHIPNLSQDRGNAIAYYAVFKTVDGGEVFSVMSVDDVIKHAEKYSKSWNSNFSPWKTSFDSMAKKTVIKQVLKYAPMSTDISRKIAADESIKSVPADSRLVEDVDILDMPNEFDFEIEEETVINIEAPQGSKHN